MSLDKEPVFDMSDEKGKKKSAKGGSTSGGKAKK
jgi:hypothetical protein